MEYQEYFSFAIAGELIFGNGCLKYLPEVLHKKEDIPEMAEIAMPILASLPGNPRAMTLEELIEVYERAS